MLYMLTMFAADIRVSNSAVTPNQEQQLVSSETQAAATAKGVMLFEDFEGSWPPPGWEVRTTNTNHNGGEPCYWSNGSGDWQNNGTWYASVWWDYPDAQNELLATPTLDLSPGLTGASLQFEQYVYLGGVGPDTLDDYWLLISEDDFSTYDVIDRYDAIPGGWDSTTVWTYDLSPYIGKSIRIGWWYWAADSAQRAVWFVDNVQIDTTGSAVAENPAGKTGVLRVFPNPSSGPVSFVLGADAEAQLAVYDATGRLVISKGFKASAEVRLEPGVYIYEVKAQQAKYTGKLVVK